MRDTFSNWKIFGEKKLLLTSFTLIAGLVGFSAPVLAHHGSRISYDLSKTVTVTGTITKYVWANPHVYFMLDVKDDSGNIVNWGAETYAPVVMARSGWTSTGLKPGDK